MRTIEIQLYKFSELSEEAKQTAIEQHGIFLNEVDAQGRNYDADEIIESIEINDYFFFNDGELAAVTTYTGKHPKSGTTVLKFHGQIIQF